MRKHPKTQQGKGKVQVTQVRPQISLVKKKNSLRSCQIFPANFRPIPYNSIRTQPEWHYFSQYYQPVIKS